MWKHYITDGMWCELCDKDTRQEVYESGHDRDSSNDWQKCLECGGRYSGYTGEWEPDPDFVKEEPKYDSRQDTLDHIQSVRKKLYTFMSELNFRASAHDKSKLQSPEKEVFDKYTPILKTLVYGSDEYKENLKNLQVALDHHYANNSHHPEYHPNGIEGMNLFDIVEMFCDWMAATERNKDGDIRNSLSINQKRFHMSDQLVNIMDNTLKHFGK